MVHILKKLQEGEGISLDEFRALKYKEREFLFNEIQYWCLYEKYDPITFASRNTLNE